MPDASVLGALPIGLILLIGTYLGYRRKRSGWNNARKKLPLVAAELGLSFRSPTHRSMIGALRGTYRGHAVFVDPDERCRIALHFESKPHLRLRTYELSKRTPPGMEPFSFSSRRLDRFFKERYAEPEIVLSLMDRSKDIEQSLEAFAGRRELRDLVITEEGIECSFDFGKPPYLPPRLVREVLPALAELAEIAQGAAKADLRLN